ncbi:MAG TPA: methylated-DNA--[protein]-cysteine S-methyltransferase [Candidatus Rifleibacterium sp.]|nr:methylated-DNA--[protein]-cysteine S-methyltransferase [Candidatus Rifleibacterium sp.]
MPKQLKLYFFETESGHAAVCFIDDAVKAVFLPERSLKNLQKRCREAFSGAVTADILNSRQKNCVDQIQKYFAGEEYDLRRIKLDLEDIAEFARRVYEELIKVGPGATVSYGQLAEMCQKPGAARAVGTAVGRNPLPLLIPCHRVINSDGRLGGFSAGGGTELKAWMLRREGLNLSPSDPLRVLPPAVFADTDIKAAIACLTKADRQLGDFIKKAPAFNLVADEFSSPFMALLETIVYQQLTGKAAATIFKRLLHLFSGGDSINPLDLIRASDEELRSAGLSGSKIAAARDLAEFAVSGKLPDLEQMHRMSNSELIEKLTAIRGIGRWTVEMLLIFKLGRVDVMAPDDYGLRKGLAVIRGTPGNLPTPKELARQSLSWQPYRSIAAWYLWRASEAAGKLKD